MAVQIQVIYSKYFTIISLYKETKHGLFLLSYFVTYSVRKICMYDAMYKSSI
jgi:hypothetical protein